MKKKLLVSFATGIFLFGASSFASAASIDVLWYGASASYDASALALSSTAGTFDPKGDGSLDWNTTIWSVGDTIDFSAYDVLVIGADGVFGTGMNSDRLLASKTQIEAARGSRTFLSGQDADWHLNHTPKDPASAFILNAVNWASSGTGLGIVSMADGWSGSGSGWWLDNNSFLKDELDGYVDYFQDENVVIPAGMEDFPVNEGLTTASLSHWGTSSHAGFDKNIAGYTSINDAGSRAGYSVTIVTQGLEGGSTSGGDDNDGQSVPEPSSMLLLATGFIGLAGTTRRVKGKK